MALFLSGGPIMEPRPTPPPNPRPAKEPHRRPQPALVSPRQTPERYVDPFDMKDEPPPDEPGYGHGV
jgi:hypothetical protein